VVLDRVEADLVTVRVAQQRRIQPMVAKMDAGVCLAEGGQPRGKGLDGRLVGHADGEVVEAGSGLGTGGVQAQGQRGPFGCSIASPMSTPSWTNSTSTR
jgi:hypothetical protein